MTEEELHLALNSGRLSKARIDKLIIQLEKRPDLVKPLLEAVFDQDKLGEFNASWVLDHLMRKKVEFLVPHIPYFIILTSHLTSESCIRPMAHICQLLTEMYFKKEDTFFTQNIAIDDIEPLVSICFDWLIGEHKVATKVFAMTSLYHLGKHFIWIHPELKLVLEDTIAKGSSGYKNRAGKLLTMLNTLS